MYILKHRKIPRTILLLLLFNSSYIYGENFFDAQNLHKTLMKDYMKDIRPNIDQTEQTLVAARVWLGSINEFEEKTNKFVFSAAFEMTWHDHRMSWNKSDYGGADDILLPHTQVWIPDLGVFNPHSEFRVLSSPQSMVGYRYDGFAFWRPADLFTTTCAADVSHYPFDTQICGGIFLPFLQLKDIFFITTNELELSYYIPSGIWDLTSSNLTSSIQEDISAQFLSITFTLQRRSKFFVISLFIPILIVGFSNVLVFMIPPDSGERVGFSVTILLAMTVFMSIVSEVLPTNSLPDVSYLCITIFVDLCVSAILTCLAIISTRIHQRVDRNIPKWLKRLVALCLCGCCTKERLRSERNSRKYVDTNEDSLHSYRPSDDSQKMTLRQNWILSNRNKSLHTLGGLPRINVDTNNLELDIHYMQLPDLKTQKSDINLDDITWVHVANFFDYIFLYLFGIGLIFKIIGMFIIYRYA